MRFQKDAKVAIYEGDLTPMIDMTFQLIAFFMVLINFSQAEQERAIMLPDSELAKPPETAPDVFITLHLTAQTTNPVIFGGRNLPIEGLGPFLEREVADAAYRGLGPEEITVIVRAHRDAHTGRVQQLIAKCQDSGLETFALRVKEKLTYQ